MLAPGGGRPRSSLPQDSAPLPSTPWLTTPVVPGPRQDSTASGDVELKALTASISATLRDAITLEAQGQAATAADVTIITGNAGLIPGTFRITQPYFETVSSAAVDSKWPCICPTV